MSSKSNQTVSKSVFHMKITLKNIKPLIWRVIQVPDEFTFYQLHWAIISAMGWKNSHLHKFEMRDPATNQEVSIGCPDEDFCDDIEEKSVKLKDYFTASNKRCEYEYDFGDGWLHVITLEKILPRDPKLGYPRCVGGKRACPPEDCGGPAGYENLLEILKDKTHPEYKEMKEWLDNVGYSNFNSELFSSDKISFTCGSDDDM